MPSITIKHAQVVEMIKFCAEHKVDKFFIAKDQGAYLGVNAQSKDGKMVSIIHYFKDCDPQKDEDWYENAHHKFGGDDFGEMLPIDWLAKCIIEKAKSVRFNVTKRSITATYQP